jgi:hypothetical protein
MPLKIGRRPLKITNPNKRYPQESWLSIHGKLMGIMCFLDLTIKIWPRDRPIAEKPVGKMSARIEHLRY